MHAGLYGVVAVDHGKVDILQLTWDGGCLDLDEPYIVGVVGNAGRRGLKVVGITQADDLLLLQEQQRATLVGGVVGDGDLSAVCDAQEVG